MWLLRRPGAAIKGAFPAHPAPTLLLPKTADLLITAKGEGKAMQALTPLRAVCMAKQRRGSFHSARQLGLRRLRSLPITSSESNVSAGFPPGLGLFYPDRGHFELGKGRPGGSNGGKLSKSMLEVTGGWEGQASPATGVSPKPRLVRELLSPPLLFMG